MLVKPLHRLSGDRLKRRSSAATFGTRVWSSSSHICTRRSRPAHLFLCFWIWFKIQPAHWYVLFLSSLDKIYNLTRSRPTSSPVFITSATRVICTRWAEKHKYLQWKENEIPFRITRGCARNTEKRNGISSRKLSFFLKKDIFWRSRWRGRRAPSG